MFYINIYKIDIVHFLSELLSCLQNIEDIPEDLKLLYKTVWEMPQKTIFEMAASRGPFIDQSQCLNVHMIDPLEKLTSMHFYAWEIVSIKCISHI